MNLDYYKVLSDILVESELCTYTLLLDAWCLCSALKKYCFHKIEM